MTRRFLDTRLGNTRLGEQINERLGAGSKTRLGALAVSAVLTVASQPARAESAAGPGIAQGMGGLLFVLLLIIGAAWIARRYLAPAATANTVARTVSGLSLGGRERVVVVEVGETWLVLGVTPQSVNTLHTLPRRTDGNHGGTGTVLPAAAQTAKNDFAAVLGKLRELGKGKR